MPENHTHKNYSPESRPPDHATSTPPEPARRRRYARSPSQAVLVPLTPVRVEMLRFLAELRFLSLPQIARLCCPSGRQDLSEKSARRHMRALFDAGLVDVLPVSRAALAPPGAPNDASLLYGSAPNVYALTARGREALHRAGLAGRPDTDRKKSAYGPKNSLFLAHELAVRDVRVWLELVARNGGHELEHWQDGEAAAISLQSDQAPYAIIRPDAWFVLRLERVVLVGLVEVDRGTERGDRRWRDKSKSYAALFANRDGLSAATGYVNARVLVLTPDARRRNALAELLAGQLRESHAAMPGHFWLADHTVLMGISLADPVWRCPGSDESLTLIPPSLVRPPVA